MTNKNNGYFSVGLSEFYAACELGLNPACLYLVMACGTSKSNLETSWSVHAACNYTGLSRGRAKKAQAELLYPDLALLSKTKFGKHPRFKFYRDDDSEVVWLPNAFVTGVAGESPPLERIRQAGDVNLLRMALDLYSVCNIADDGGVDRNVVGKRYKRFPVASHAEFEIYGFTLDSAYCYPSHPVVSPHVDCTLPQGSTSKMFFDRLGLLEQLGLFSFNPVLFESGEGEVICPIVSPFTGEELYNYRDIAQQVLPPDYTGITVAYDYLLPIPRHLQNVTLSEVLIPRYRQNTAMTQAGYAMTTQRLETWSQTYQSLESAISRVYQRNIKGNSKVVQGLYQGVLNERSS